MSPQRGMVLVAVGYSVDSITGNYLGNIADIPGILDKFAVMMGVIPAVLAGISIFIMIKMYPIDDKLRKKMNDALQSDWDSL